MEKGGFSRKASIKKDANFTEYSNDEIRVLLDSLIKGDKDSNHKVMPKQI